MYAYPLTRTSTERALPALLASERRPLSGVGVASVRQRILLPFDGSPACESALAHVRALSKAYDIEIHLLNVQPPVMAGEVTLFMTAQTVELQRRAAAERVLSSAKGELRSLRIPYVTEVAFGSPAEEIVRCAATSHCTKIVMGTRAGFRGLLRRSVAHRVVRRAPVPVTIVKPGSTSEQLGMRARLGQLATLCTQGLRSWRKRSCAGARTYQTP
jgi:nucleotide-binding universal stress UspA family protein